MTALVCWLALAGLAVRGAPAQITIEPREATVGDALTVRVSVEADPDAAAGGPRMESLGPQIGPFSVLDEQWTPQTTDAGGLRWLWLARVAAYKVGDLEFPALTLAAAEVGGEAWTTEPFGVRIVSVLPPLSDDAEPEQEEIADLKAPASLNPNLKPVAWALGLLLLLLVAAAIAWWLHRKYAARFAAAPLVEDPFSRIAPHEWAFSALRDLLEKKASFESEDLFYAQLAWILKRYLGGRYRVELLERTTDEVQPLLEQAGAPTTAATRAGAVLQACDVVKFANKRHSSDADQKEIVERVYGIVDQTKPVARAVDSQQGAA